jgi:hypothetical protein
MMHFSTFTTDLNSRQALRRSCRLLDDLVGSQTAIYMHELMPQVGESVAAVAAWLQREIGPAMPLLKSCNRQSISVRVRVHGISTPSRTWSGVHWRTPARVRAI